MKTILNIAIWITLIIASTFCFVIFLQLITAIASFVLVDLSSMTQKDVITTGVQKYFIFTSDNIPEFSSRVSQSAIGAVIGMTFTLVLNFLIKIRSDTKNRVSSLRTALVIVELNIQSLLLLKKQFLLPKYEETKNDDYIKSINDIVKMSQNEFFSFLEARSLTFKKILNEKHSIDLNPKEFFYFLETEPTDARERLDIMLYHYCRIKENIGHLNKVLEFQGDLIDECGKFDTEFYPILGEKRIEYSAKFLHKLKKLNDDTLTLVDTTLVFALELKSEIEIFPKMYKHNEELKLEFVSLLPKNDIYEKVLDEKYYLRYKKRTNLSKKI
jgi:hypothetical protein